MHLRKLFLIAAASLCFAAAAMAQSDAAAPSQPDASAKPPAKSKKKSKSKKGGARKTSKKSRKKKSSAPSAAIQTVEPVVPDDGEPPQLTHQPVAAGTRGKPLTIAAHAVDANGVFGPILYVRKRGLGTGDYVPIRMIASKIVPGDYSVDVPAALINLDGLEYYIEAWDTAGNGPTRAGSSEVPMAAALEEEKRAIALPTLPANVTSKPKGAPPAIPAAALTQARTGTP